MTNLLTRTGLEALVGAGYLDTQFDVLSPSYRAMMFVEPVKITPLEPLPQDQDLSAHTVLSLFGLSAGEDGIAAKYAQYKDRIGQQFIPIADDGLGNLFVVNKVDQKVLFWYHESPNGEDSPNAFAVVSADLDEFLSGIDVFIAPNGVDLKSGVKRVTLNF